VIRGAARTYSGDIIHPEPERITMSLAIEHLSRQPARFVIRRPLLIVVALTAALLASATARAQATRSAGATPAMQATAHAPTLASGPDLQGLWDFTMRVGERTSTGFFALGPVEQGWAGSLTPDATNTLAIRTLTVTGDSVRMVVASREGDVRFQGRLTDNGRAMEGIVEYHGGLLVPMTATQRARRGAPR
jgi:hypothetical protein